LQLKTNHFYEHALSGCVVFPGNDSYMVKLVHDAGGRYVFENLKGSRSYPLGMEKAFEAGLGIDIWLNPGSASNLTDITSFDTRLASCHQ
jgi:iron complex transport system substrate-binding protein